MRSLVIGLRLWGIADDPFWPGAERLLDLAHLGALEVADLGREPLHAGARERDRLEQLRVAVAGDDLGGDRLGSRPSRASTRASKSGGCVAYVPTAPEIAPTDAWEKACAKPLRVAVRLEGEAGELDAEGRGLGVHAVRAPDAQRLAVLARARPRERRPGGERR